MLKPANDGTSAPITAVSWLEKVPVRRLAVLVFLFALTVRVGALTFWPSYYVHALKSQVEMRNIAITLAKTGQFANPYGVPTGQTAHLAPVAPFLASLIYRRWGISDRAEFVRGIVCALTSALACGLTVLLGVELRLGHLASLCAGILAALAPHAAQLHADLTEFDACLGTALFICAMLILVRAVEYPGSRRLLTLFGLLAGLAILTYNSLLAPLAALMVCAILPFRRNPLRLPVKYVFGMLVLTSLVVLPWSIRNFLVFKQWVTVRSNFGLEFRIAQSDFSPDDATMQIHPASSEQTRALIRKLGEPAAYASLERDGFEWVRSHPLQFVRRVLWRVICFWVPVASSHLKRFISLIVACAALSGFLLLVRHKHPAAVIIGLVWIAYPAVYYLLQSEARYQQPIAFSLYLMAAVLIRELLTRQGRYQNEIWSFGKMAGRPAPIMRVAAH